MACWASCRCGRWGRGVTTGSSARRTGGPGAGGGDPPRRRGGAVELRARGAAVSERPPLAAIGRTALVLGTDVLPFLGGLALHRWRATPASTDAAGLATLQRRFMRTLQ